MPIQRLSHIGICVADLERARAFYRDGLGFEERSRFELSDRAADKLLQLPDLSLEALYLERDGTRIELLYYPTPGHVGTAEPRAMNALGLTHLSFRVQEIDAVIERLVGLGGRVLEATRVDNPRYQASAVFLVDPDGTRIELVEQPGDPDSLPGS
jgi:catechol 2,3-dioxygenase-like lactoylglutathione lyase family enzyme